MPRRPRTPRRIPSIYNIRNDPSVIIAASDAYNGGKTNYDLFANPRPTGLQTAKDYSESFPILVDPIGSQELTGRVRIGSAACTSELRGRAFPFANTNVSIYRSFTLWDNINFEADGSTNAVAAPQMVGTTVLRDSRFSWAYLFRRPQTANRSIVDCSIIVFDKRSNGAEQFADAGGIRVSEWGAGEFVLQSEQ